LYDKTDKPFQNFWVEEVLLPAIIKRFATSFHFSERFLIAINTSSNKSQEKQIVFLLLIHALNLKNLLQIKGRKSELRNIQRDANQRYASAINKTKLSRALFPSFGEGKPTLGLTRISTAHQVQSFDFKISNINNVHLYSSHPLWFWPVSRV